MHRLRLRRHPRLSLSLLLLLFILLLALGLRLYGLNWDDGNGFHPDERSIYMRAGCMYDVLTEAPGYRDCIYTHPETEPGIPSLSVLLDPDRSPLNPHWFPLGSILIYAIVFFRSIVEPFTDVYVLDMSYVGRPLSALADVGTVLLIYLLGRRMYGPRVGLLASALSALAVVHIQNSHFYRPETFSVLFTLASFWAMLRMVERRRLGDSALLGLLVGLALAPKVNVLPLVLPLLLAYGYFLLDSVNGRWSDITPQAVGRVLAYAAVGGGVALVVFFITMPYALLQFGAFLDELQAQTNMARHAGLWPFTTQYINTPPFLYQIRQSALWGLGLPLGIVAWTSIPFTAALALRRRETRRADLLLLAWVVPNFLLLEAFEVRFLRYIFPLMPFMILMGSRMLLWLVEGFRQMARSPSPSMGKALACPESRDRGASSGNQSAPAKGEEARNWRRHWASPTVARYLSGASVALLIFVVGATAFYALALEKVYANDHTAVVASRWINQNLPPGMAIISDNHWDEFLPDLYRYNTWQFPVYEPDTPPKMDTLAQHLAASDYLVFYSNRPYGSIARVPDRYPLSANYYRRLFRGELGYRLERSFSSYPGLLGVSFEDDPFGRAGLPRPVPRVPNESAPLAFNLGYADNDVITYDHPTVLVFRNVDQLPEDTLRLRLVADQTAPKASSEIGSMLSEEAKTVQRRGGTWSAIIHRDSWTNRLPVLPWLLVIELMYLAALPLALFIFRPLPDRGIILARGLGLLAVSYVAWVLASLGWIGFSRTSILLGFLVVGALSALALVVRWGEVKNFLARRWRLLLVGEMLFLVAFLAFVAIRAANPDLWHPFRGGEKPMELAYLNAVLRSTTMPPYDPWFAGGYMNYYYWGYFILATLIKITGILPTTAFNLAVPLIFALTVTAAYSLVYNLAEGVRRSRATPAQAQPAAVAPAPAVRMAPRPVQQTLAPSLLKRILWSPVGAGLVAGLLIAAIGNLDGMVQLAQGGWHSVVEGQSFPPFDYWRSSRMLPNLENIEPSGLAFWLPDKLPGAPEVSPHITEFPFFSFLFADLHPHVMVIPFTLLVIGLGLNLVVGLPVAGRLWLVAASATLALALGGLWVINSWDYPSYLLLTLALLGLAVYLHRGSPLQKLGLFVAMGSGVVAVSVLAFLPFHQAYEAFDVGLSVSKWRTPIDRYLGIHGLFLFIVASFLIYHTRRILAQVLVSLLPRPLPKLALAMALSAVIFLAATRFWTAAMLLLFLTLAGLAAGDILRTRGDGRPFAAVPVALLGLALAIGIGVDFVRLTGDIGRMNTLFKYYLEAWVLFSLAAAYMLWHLGSQGLFHRSRGTGSRAPAGWLKGAWLGVLALLLMSSLVYTVLGTRGRLADRFNTDIGSLTLDGTAFMAEAVHWEGGKPVHLKADLEAIQWLQDQVEGSPVVLEGHNEQYHWSARIASYTGLPTVLGWPWHQTQQRMGHGLVVRERASLVQELYDTTDLRRTEELLRQYEIAYIVVGELERIYYSPEGVKKFEDMANRGLITRAFESDSVTIYRVVTPTREKTSL